MQHDAVPLDSVNPEVFWSSYTSKKCSRTLTASMCNDELIAITDSDVRYLGFCLNDDDHSYSITVGHGAVPVLLSACDACRRIVAIASIIDDRYVLLSVVSLSSHVTLDQVLIPCENNVPKSLCWGYRDGRGTDGVPTSELMVCLGLGRAQLNQGDSGMLTIWDVINYVETDDDHDGGYWPRAFGLAESYLLACGMSTIKLSHSRNSRDNVDYDLQHLNRFGYEIEIDKQNTSTKLVLPCADDDHLTEVIELTVSKHAPKFWTFAWSVNAMCDGTVYNHSIASIGDISRHYWQRHRIMFSAVGFSLFAWSFDVGSDDMHIFAVCRMRYPITCILNINEPYPNVEHRHSVGIDESIRQHLDAITVYTSVHDPHTVHLLVGDMVDGISHVVYRHDLCTLTIISKTVPHFHCIDMWREHSHDDEYDMKVVVGCRALTHNEGQQTVTIRRFVTSVCMYNHDATHVVKTSHSHVTDDAIRRLLDNSSVSIGLTTPDVTNELRSIVSYGGASSSLSSRTESYTRHYHTESCPFSEHHVPVCADSDFYVHEDIIEGGGHAVSVQDRYYIALQVLPEVL